MSHAWPSGHAQPPLGGEARSARAEAQGTPLLEIRKLKAWYGDVQVLFGYDLSVNEGGVTALLGANGAGKTTTLRAIFNVMVRREGDIRFAGQSIMGREPQDIVRLGISHVPDGRGTFAELSVEENLQLGGATLSRRIDVDEGVEQVYALLPKLKERRQQQAGTLSGGEQQMLAIGRALMPNPRLILLDEPSFGLAPLIVRSIFETLRRIVAERRIGVLIVEQNVGLALDIADQACLIDVGRAVVSGTAEQIRQDPTVRQVYLGH